MFEFIPNDHKYLFKTNKTYFRNIIKCNVAVCKLNKIFIGNYKYLLAIENIQIYFTKRIFCNNQIGIIIGYNILKQLFIISPQVEVRSFWTYKISSR